MKRVVLASTILASLAIAAGGSALLPQSSAASPTAKPEPQPVAEAKLAKPAETPSPKSSAEATVRDSGRPPVPLVRPKREQSEPTITAEAPPPAAPAETRGWDNQLGAVDDGHRWADAAPRWPDPSWMQQGLPPPPAAFVQRGQEPRYFWIPLGGQRVLVVARDFEWGGKKDKGRRRGRDRD